MTTEPKPPAQKCDNCGSDLSLGECRRCEGIHPTGGKRHPEPGVTVRIWHGNPGYTECLISLDGVPKEVFSAVTRVSTDDPDEAEAYCRKRLGELVERLFPGGVMLASTHGFSMDLQNIAFVRE